MLNEIAKARKKYIYCISDIKAVSLKSAVKPNQLLIYLTTQLISNSSKTKKNKQSNCLIASKTQMKIALVESVAH